MMLRCEIITLFPDMVRAVIGASMLRRACEAGRVDVRVVDLRDYAVDRHRTADDVPYGGGAGMVLKVEPVARAVDALREDGEPRRWILTSPRGRHFSYELAMELSREDRRLTLLCGHYEGVDERVHGTAPWEDVSIGDYVLTGGELAALVMLDATARLVPGVLGDPRSAHEESFVDSLLEYPHYTRPAEFRGMRVPEVLLSGHHRAISQWRRDQALEDTRRLRPDLFERVAETDAERSRITQVTTGSPAERADGTN
jgi:tRNA (guanine37-N1)-methyltransferase